MINNLHSTCTNDTQIGSLNAQAPPRSTQPKARILAYDGLRVIGMLAVIGIHTLMTARAFPANPQIGKLDDLLHFAVPLLVFLSGALVWGPRSGTQSVPLRTFFKKRGLRVGLPYVVWFAIFALLLYQNVPYSGALMPSGSPNLSLFDIAGYLGSGHVWYHLYFIPMILTFYVLTPLVGRLMPSLRWGPEFAVLVALGLRVYAWPPLLEQVSALNNPYLVSYLTHFFVHLPHMALGCWFAYRWGAWLRDQSTSPNNMLSTWSTAPWWSLINLTAALLLLGLIAGPSWMSALSNFGKIATLVLSAVILIPVWQATRAWLLRLSSLTFGAYFIHPLALAIAQAIFPLNNYATLWTSWWFLPLLFFYLIASSFGGAYLLSLSKRTNWLIGE